MYLHLELTSHSYTFIVSNNNVWLLHQTDQLILIILFYFIQYLHLFAHIVKNIQCDNYFYFYLLYVG